MKKATAIRMEETTARRLKIAATLAGLPAGDFLALLLDDWETARGLKFILSEQIITGQSDSTPQ